MKPPTSVTVSHTPLQGGGLEDHDWLLRELRLYQVELEMQNEELRNAQSAIEASRDLYLDLYEHAPVGYLTLDFHGVVQAVNHTGETMLGWSRHTLLKRRFARRIVDTDRDQWQQVFSRLCRDGLAQECDLSLRRADGSQWHARLNCIQQKSKVPTIRLTLTDMTTRLQVENHLKLAASVFTHAREGIIITDTTGKIIEVNDAFSTITGYSRAEAVGKNPRLLASGLTPPAQYVNLWDSLKEHYYWQGDLWNRRCNGELFAARQTITAILDAQGQPQYYVALFTDVTEAHEHQRHLEYIAHYDSLTNLPNRVLLASRMHEAMAIASRTGSQLAVAYVDLDGFKTINDEHGHEMGDRLLVNVSRRMKQVLPEGCTMARLGGDEFVVLIVDLDHVCDSAIVLGRLLAAASDTVQVGALRVALSASVGVSYFPQECDINADQLLRQADQAMYQAKLAGKNRFHIFDAKSDLNTRGRNAWLDRIDKAIREQELRLYYQPKVNLRTGEVVGAEALLRWQHPEKGLLMPDHFLPLIENNALSEMVGEWVLENALIQIAHWQREGLRLAVSINIGARQLQHPDFVAKLMDRLAAHSQVEPHMLIIEILETSALENIEHVSLALRKCAAIGVRFALDDFGTGYSSLSYLKRLPVAQLKIDQTFIHGLFDTPSDVSILQAILGLASAFGLEVIAEGVDGTAQAAQLLELGCEVAQGYGIAQPMPPSAIHDWIVTWSKDPRPRNACDR